MKYILAFIMLIGLSLGSYFTLKTIEKNEKQTTLLKQTHKFKGYSKPRSTFVLHRAYDKNENKLKITVEVVGPFENYKFKWWMPNGASITAGDETGTIDASEAKVFTHEIEFSGLTDGEQIVFETFTLADDIKLGATHIYTYGDDTSVAEEDSEFGIMSKGTEKKNIPFKVMQ